MEEKDIEKINKIKEDLKKCIDRIYNTTSLGAETTNVESICALIKKIEKDELIEFTSELDIFGKCVLYYKLPIEYRLMVEFINAARVSEGDRLLYWKDYKVKLKEQKLNPEEEYNKIIMMACILHVPIEDEKIEEAINKLKEEADKQIEENREA